MALIFQAGFAFVYIGLRTVGRDVPRLSLLVESTGNKYWILTRSEDIIIGTILRINKVFSYLGLNSV